MQASAPVQRVAVLRALQLGDMMCAVPALRALRRAYPAAEIALIGLPWSAPWCQRLPHVDRWFEFPGWPGLPERAPDLPAVPGFLALMQASRFDLAVQMHGSGEIVNPLVASFGARAVAGFRREGQFCADPALHLPWPAQGHEIERCLQLTDALGAPRAGTQLEFPVLSCDRTAVAQRWSQLRVRPYAVVHAGAQLPSRRWPVARFAAVARALREAGFTVVLTGSDPERPLAAELAAAIGGPPSGAVVNLVGETSLWQLGAVLERAALLVCNDTGVSHVAAALRTPSVVICCGADPARWAPLDARLHRVLAAPVDCRPCMHRVCPIGHGCATAIEPAAVLDAAFALLAEVRVGAGSAGRPAAHWQTDDAPA